MTHVACEKIISFLVRSSILPFPIEWVATRHAAVYYVRDANAFSAGIVSYNFPSKWQKNDDK